MKNQYSDYFGWMMSKIDTRAHMVRSYTKLLNFLDSVVFRFSLEMDSNRYYDGLDLRKDYVYECDIQRSFLNLVEDRPCSVLEMMLALARRCERDIMYDCRYGDRTSIWFWYMIQSLGLSKYTNEYYNEDDVDQIISNFMDRRYSNDGHGSLFVIEHSPYDLRDVEIWDQMNLYCSCCK